MTIRSGSFWARIARPTEAVVSVDPPEHWLFPLGRRKRGNLTKDLSDANVNEDSARLGHMLRHYVHLVGAITAAAALECAQRYQRSMHSGLIELVEIPESCIFQPPHPRAVRAWLRESAGSRRLMALQPATIAALARLAGGLVVRLPGLNPCLSKNVFRQSALPPAPP